MWLSALPSPIAAALTGYSSSGDDLRTESEAGVFLFSSPGSNAPDLFLKCSRSRLDPSLESEAAVMRWLNGKLPVPRVVLFHRERDVEYLLVNRLPGLSGEHRELYGDRNAIAHLFAHGLARIHMIPLEGCPQNRHPDALLERARKRWRDGVLTRDYLREGGLERAPEAVLDRLAADLPPLDCPVFVHGDYCLPNVLIGGDRVTGFIDLGNGGIGDPYYDYVSSVYTLNRNLGPEYIAPFFETIGVTLDPIRFAWYESIIAFD